MSYKNNGLKKLRENYWNKDSERNKKEKLFLKELLLEHQVFLEINEVNLKFFFDSLPSEVILKAYGLGFKNDLIKRLLITHIEKNKNALKEGKLIKTEYKIKD